ncbi:hypothetical protein NEOLEDRAFT_906996 [Neolentinus lepideus HHB14362 ss-1]|uniref:Secreted protein n=1 Tax=Neolentinus lepideus HHB14362 ss-1 TaxID=1314782 RepID=A0A165UJ46_9AGAM|nr:hypothetical protein NEOLEDRAFT_906996 [Neolentinus lepideus HHB14362 ss-1]
MFPSLTALLRFRNLHSSVLHGCWAVPPCCQWQLVLIQIYCMFRSADFGRNRLGRRMYISAMFRRRITCVVPIIRWERRIGSQVKFGLCRSNVILFEVFGNSTLFPDDAFTEYPCELSALMSTLKLQVFNSASVLVKRSNWIHCGALFSSFYPFRYDSSFRQSTLSRL